MKREQWIQIGDSNGFGVDAARNDCNQKRSPEPSSKTDSEDYDFTDTSIVGKQANPNDTIDVSYKKSNIELNSNYSKDCLAKKLHKIRFPYGKSKTVGNMESEDKIVRNMYITTCKPASDTMKATSMTAFEQAMQKVVEGKVKLSETTSGIIVSFNKEEDCDRTIKLNMSKIFGKPTVVWNIPQPVARFTRCAVIRDVPWCVSIKEVESLLKCHGVQPQFLSRDGCSSIRIEVKNTSSLDKLLMDGLSFFNCTTLPVVLEPNEDGDVIQCYKCQRFWHTAAHCPYHVRCVRCGEKHDVRECPRSRKNPVCCLCGESHHAAYKLCPVRMQHLNSVQVEFALCKQSVVDRP